MPCWRAVDVQARYATRGTHDTYGKYTTGADLTNYVRPSAVPHARLAQRNLIRLVQWLHLDVIQSSRECFWVG